MGWNCIWICAKQTRINVNYRIFYTFFIIFSLFFSFLSNIFYCIFSTISIYISYILLIFIKLIAILIFSRKVKFWIFSKLIWMFEIIILQWKKAISYCEHLFAYHNEEIKWSSEQLVSISFSLNIFFPFLHFCIYFFPKFSLIFFIFKRMFFLHCFFIVIWYKNLYEIMIFSNIGIPKCIAIWYFILVKW